MLLPPLVFLFVSIPMKRVAITQYFQAAKRTVASSSAKDSTPDATLVKSSMAVAANKSEDGEVAVSSVTEWVALAAVPESWRDFFEKESSKPYFKVLTGFVRTEQSKHTVYPPEAEIFTAFKLSPLDRVRVVIIGQDPYHGPGQAHGLAFSVKSAVALPPSLRNIMTELRSDLGVPPTKNGNLERWSKQGVFLLNTCLTVRKGEANSHQGKGWETFTDATIKLLAAGDRRLVFLLWGKPAQAKIASCSIDAKKHTVITCSHPSPLSAYKTGEPFIGSKCFSRCNAALAEIEGPRSEPIDWATD